MNILIPLGGIGKRFSDEGYSLPKPLIKIFDKTMIEYVIDSLNITENDKIFIIYNKCLDEYDFCNFIKNLYPLYDIQCIQLNCNTSGATETIMIGLNYILNNIAYNIKTLIIDCDTFYTEDIVSKFRNFDNNAVFFTKRQGEPEIYSYIKLDDENKILDIMEKKKISNNANTGAYAFSNIHELYKYCVYVIDNKILFNNEFYTSCVIHEMLNAGYYFEGIQLQKECVFSVGTPKELDLFKNNTMFFLFDLDGTIVLTDEIYFNVWRDILKKYNVVLTKEIFKRYIQGNNDKYVIKTLLPNVDIDLNKISNLKDEGFIKNISELTLIDGIETFISSLRKMSHKCCIVTNCNKSVAEAIMSHIGFNKYIDFVITSDDCEIGKPSPQPYMKAIDKYCTTSDKCFIFEDSKTGILSAMSVNPKLVIGVETLYSNKELKQYGIQKSILNYVNLTYNDIINTIDEDLVDLKNIIKNNVLMNVTEIVINNNKLKGGYIADVIGVALKDCSTSHNFVLKYENKTENSLSFMAKKLDLYEREYYFYETVSKHVNIKIPKYICVVRDDKRENFGILLENLLVENHFTINLNLSNESIDVSLKIVESMALLHSNFWNKNLRLIFPKLKSTIDPIFRPFLKDFIFNKIDLFKEKWGNILNDKIYLCDKICEDFENIQYRLSESNITFIHGDIKSPNIIYDRSNNDEPYFIDWQHCGIGKGTQDVIFFIIESFDTNELPIIYPLIKSYYYKKLLENGIQNYSYKQYESDLIDSLFYIPFFTAVWFGTTPNDELIDKNFPFFFIQKLFFLYSII